MKGFIFLTMIFAHTIADYVLQTDFLAKFKQKKNWESYGDKYRCDYIVILFMHSFMWSFCIHLPLLLLKQEYTLISILIAIHASIHMIIDDEKANKLSINLNVDQLLHLLQIITSFIIYILI